MKDSSAICVVLFPIHHIGIALDVKRDLIKKKKQKNRIELPTIGFFVCCLPAVVAVITAHCSLAAVMSKAKIVPMNHVK